MGTNKSLSQIRRMDHLGLVAGVARRVRLVEILDRLIPPAPQRRVSVGEAVLALVLNGLGFVSRPLYLTPAYFEGKPVGPLIRTGLRAEDLNEFVLGRALDDLHEAGLSRLFLHLASAAVGLSRRGVTFFHLDSTSFTLSGRYAGSENREDEAEEDGEPDVVRITHGYSKDHRPDLKQFVLNMITLHKSRIPVWIEALDGNTVDKTSFSRTIDAFLAQVGESDGLRCFVADSALYTKKTIGGLSGKVQWVTRVPETVGPLKKLLEEIPEESFVFDPERPGYRWCELGSTFGGVRQRWVVVFSRSARDREAKTLERAVERERKTLEKALKEITGLRFSCPDDARKAWDSLRAGSRYHRFSAGELTEERGYASPGRPRDGASPRTLGVRITGTFETDPDAVEKTLARKGFFVVATNTLDTTRLSGRDLLDLYKAQGTSIELGFRFLKDPLFFADAFFLKSEKRIMALTMVMAIALLIYALAEEELRETLKKLRESLPDQKKKPTSRPTMRWIFQLMDNIHWKPSRGDPGGEVWMKDVQRKIVSFFSPEVRRSTGSDKP